MVVGVLLYGAEGWVSKKASIRKLESFNNKCLRCILGITEAQHPTSCISAEVRKRFGIEEMVEDMIAANRVRWLGYVARMDESHLPEKDLVWLVTMMEISSWYQAVWRDKLSKDL